MNEKEYTATANLGPVEIPENMKPYILELMELRKKATPKKPEKRKIDSKIKVNVCTACGKIVRPYEKRKYCHECGQAIDWEEVK